MTKLTLEQIELSALGELVDSHDWGAGYLDPLTGEVISTANGELFDAEGETTEPEDHWLPVGGGSSRAAYEDMEGFAAALADRRLGQRLERSLEGKGAFRRFRDVMYREADAIIGRAWNVVRTARSEQRALAWLDDEELVEPAEVDAASKALEAVVTAALREVGVATTGARLILLNGMPGVGKSTLAARYLAEHPGVLCVEADVLRTWIGGDPDDHAEAARHLSLALAAAHLKQGHDVVVPQLVARVDQIEHYEAVARDAGAELVEVVLHGEVVETRVPSAAVKHLDAYADGLVDVVAGRPATHRLAIHHDIGDTYRDLLDLLDLLDPDVPPEAGRSHH